MQAYLGARFVADAVRARDHSHGGPTHPTVLDEQYLDEALGAGPSREFLQSLVFLSREEPRVPPGEASGTDATARRERIGGCVTKLRKSTTGDGGPGVRREDDKALDMFTAALELDFACSCRQLADLADTIASRWPGLRARDEQGFKDAKLRLVRRLADVARRHAADLKRDQANAVVNDAIVRAYKALFRIALVEPVYGVRLAIAEEISCGGDLAFDALESKLSASGSVAEDTGGEPVESVQVTIAGEVEVRDTAVVAVHSEVFPRLSLPFRPRCATSGSRS